jgi:aerobic carbon-monoxide dehydrogenase small subunit
MIKSFRTIERTIALTVNGETVCETVEPRVSARGPAGALPACRRAWGRRAPLVDCPRERLGLTGSHVGCEQGVCGACTVRLDGVTARSFLVLAVPCAGRKVETRLPRKAHRASRERRSDVPPPLAG